MRVPARIYASEAIWEDIEDKSMEQLINMATLPGIVRYSMAMPDAHQGYGACIGGVFATDISKNGIISPGSIGYDLNCGIRVLSSSVDVRSMRPYLEKLADELYRSIPSGVGRGGNIKLDKQSMNKVLTQGVKQVVSQGYGIEDDIKHCESYGSLEQADSSKVSDRAKMRGRDQLGTLGSGNHFAEVQKVDTIFNTEIAEKFGLKQGQIVVMIHTGSRGLGHQVCTDWVRTFNQKLPEWGIKLPDRELACAPINTPEAQGYLGAMSAAANFAWSNRQLITYLVRQAWKRIIPASLGHDLKLIYDVAHNMGKVEEYEINGKKTKVIVHRKGATRAFPPGNPELAEDYQKTGQPVLIPGSMGTASYILAGVESGEEAFFSSCHGAGRTMSRRAAKRAVRGSDLIKELAKKGIIVKCRSWAGVAEEAPLAYKDVDQVVDVVHNAGLAQKVARLVPLAVIKGE
ncbi:RtcB family protein [Patescibacteria group bacterium AH-259-L07]|nr:RtcB family protein [Patescibacteria group bacterium AH-259-L07]